MNPLRIFWTRIHSLWQRRGVKREIDEELRFHIEQRTAENVVAGMSLENAAREARKRFGNLQSVREECRESRGASFGEQTIQDIRFGFRLLRKQPTFTAVAVITLALGIGANTAVFSVVNAVLLRPLPYPESDRLVAVCESNPRQGWNQYVTSLGAYADWRQDNSVFQEMAAATVLGPAPIMGADQAELVHVAAVSANFFGLLGIQPILGQPFCSEEEKPEHGNVVLLSERLWRERFGGATTILNQNIRLGDRSYTVAGVMPASVRLFDPAGVQGWDKGFAESDVWRPLPVESGLRKQRNYRAFLVLGRLKPFVTLAQARIEMATLASKQAKDFPDSNAGWSVLVEPWQRTVVHSARIPLLLLFATVGVVLLIVTANLANLCLARGMQRQTEFAIRMAVGADLVRLARQFLAESLLLSLLGGAAGLLVAHWGLALLTTWIPATIPRTDVIHLDGWVLGFTIIASCVVGLFIGLAPLLAFWRGRLDNSLRSAARGSTLVMGGRRLRAALMAGQVALVIILLTGAGLLTRSFQRLSGIDPGFRTPNVVAMDISLGGSSYTNELRRIQFVDQLLARLANVPGIESAAAVDGLPLDPGRSRMDIALTSVEGSSPAAPEERRIAGLCLASPNYFTTLGVPLVRGRFFTDQDSAGRPPTVIINEAFARCYFPGTNPVGKYIGSPDFGPELCEIVGVVGDVRQSSLDALPKPEAFRPLLQECFSSCSIVARCRSTSPQLFASIRSEVSRLDSSVPAYSPRALDQVLATSVQPRRFGLWLISSFAALALVLAMIGIYGVVACAVNERRRELGIRFALGAQKREVLQMVLLRGMRVVAVGGLTGLAGAGAMSWLLRSLFYGVSPFDPLTFFLVVILVSVTAGLACLLPARRAAQVDPIEALRNE